MKNKQMLLAKIPFILILVAIFVAVSLDLMDVKMAMPLTFICLGCQQVFIGLRFYKEDKKLRINHILFGIGCFVFTLLMILKTYHRV